MPEVTHTNTPASDTRRVLVLVPNDADTGVAFDQRSVIFHATIALDRGHRHPARETHYGGDH